MSRAMADLKMDRENNPKAFAQDRWEDDAEEEEVDEGEDIDTS